MLNRFLVLAGRYRVIQTLGEGGLAKTYIAEDHLQPSRPKCAVKLLKPASNDSSFLPIARRLFRKEAEILEKLGRHHQIPQLLAHFEEKKEFFIIQEFIEGHTLSTELPSGHCWSENKVILMLQDILKTLEFVHSYNVIHRDIKPNNLIRRDEDGKLVLIDFGAVKQVGDPRITTKAPLTPKTISIGTQGYMPTEQARGKPRLNSDIYALGMIGIQALTGIDPINLQEDADGEVIWQNHAKVSDRLGLVLSKMVCYHFRDRYQSATEVLQALESLNNYSLDSQPILANSQQSSITLSESNLRETKVSLGEKHSKVKVISNDIVEESEISLEVNKSITKEVSPEKLRETKISLDNKHLDTKQISETNFRKTKKSQGIDPWSSWDNENNPENLEQPKTSVDIKKINSETLSLERSRRTQGFVEKDSWGFWNSETDSKSLQNMTKNSLKTDYLNSENTSQIEPKDSRVAQNNTKNDQTLVSKPEIRETKMSLENKHLDIKVAPKLDLKETKISLKNEHKNSKSVSQSKLEETKISLPNKHLKLQSNSQVNLQETKLSLSNEKSNTKTVSNLAIEKIKISIDIKQLKFKINFKDIEKITNPIFLTLSQFHRVDFNTFIKNNKKKSLLIGSGLGLVIISLYVVYSNLKERQLYSQIQQDLEQIEMLKTAKQYQECINLAQIFPRTFSDLSIEADTLLEECYMEQLTKAQDLANQSKFKDAIHLASQIPKDMNIYSKAQELISQWSQQIYQIANNKYQEGKLEEAIAIAQAVPTSSPMATELQVTVKQWNKDWKLNQTYLQAAKKGLNESRWQDAIDEAKKVKNNKFLRNQSQEIVKKAESEISALASNVNSYSSSSSSASFPVTTSPSTTSSSFSSVSSPSTTSSDSKPTSIVCLNKNSRIPRCHN
jgi:serine/threonine protein kinase